MGSHEGIKIISPGNFEPENHYYTKVLNSQIHPLISSFITMSKESLINRYCHLHPLVNRDKLNELIMYQPQFLRWAGADLFYVTTKSGERKMVLLETNSCPSGQKSMPLLIDHNEQGGYKRLIESVFLPLLSSKSLPKGKLAVIYDKNYVEASGYAASIADLTNENVFLVSFYNNAKVNERVRFIRGVLEIKDDENVWHKVRAAFRYVTQKPWNRIPIHTKTLIFNPVLGCLAGGRNKLIAAKAYDFLNSELEGTGLSSLTPETIYDVAKEEIPLWVQRFGGHAVIKNPYSNAGQGVFTITSKKELSAFMNMEHQYNQFIVQGLIGNYKWSSKGKTGKFYHVGTMPNKKGEIFVADIRMMVMATENGFKPVSLYARRANSPLLDSLKGIKNSWDLLGTNLSIKLGENKWDSDESRLMIMDRKDFNKLGIGIDDLIEGYIQTILSIIAIDKMALNLLNKKGQFKIKLFRSLNDDKNLIKEILVE